MNIVEEFEQIRYECDKKYYCDDFILVILWWKLVYYLRVIKLIILKATWKQKIFALIRAIFGIIERLLFLIVVVGIPVCMLYVIVNVYLFFIPLLDIILSIFHWDNIVQFNEWFLTAVPIGIQHSWNPLVGFIRFVALFIAANVLPHLYNLYTGCLYISGEAKYDDNTKMKKRAGFYTLRVLISLLFVGLTWGLLYLFCFVITPDMWTPLANWVFKILLILFGLWTLSVMFSGGEAPSMSGDLPSMPDDFLD